VDPEPFGDDLLPLAKRAVGACPVLALTLEVVPADIPQPFSNPPISRVD